MNIDLQDRLTVEHLATFFDGIREHLGEFLGDDEKPFVVACFGWLRCLWADQGYAGPDFAAWVAAHRKTGTLRLEVIQRDKCRRGFGVLAKRWIVERTFGWFTKHRRLVRNYEINAAHSEAL